MIYPAINKIFNRRESSEKQNESCNFGLLLLNIYLITSVRFIMSVLSTPTHFETGKLVFTKEHSE
jgi:hypothetical protein